MDAPWRLIPARDAQPPAAPAEARARGWLRDLLAGWRRDGAPEDEVGPAEDRLRPIEEARLERLAPAPPRAAQHAALDTWRAQVDRGVVLRPDDGGWDAALDEERPGDAAVMRPPIGDALPSEPPDALLARLDDPVPLHLARLEGWWVRHHDGLEALRALLTRLRARSAPWTADVSPWAWAWMRRLLPEAQALPAAWATAPLDGEAVGDWLGGAAPLRVRGTGAEPDAAFFRSLALRAQGGAGVARAIWLACLRDGAEAARAEDDAAGAEATVWLRSPSDVELPDTVGLEREDLLVAHAALLHGPSSEVRLTRALTTLAPQVGPSLATLAARGLLARDDDGLWRPRPEALPALGARLTAEAFTRAEG
jgi:hypothetical protein